MTPDDSYTFEEMRTRLVTLLHPEHEVDNVLAAILQINRGKLEEKYPTVPRTASQFYLMAVSILAERRQTNQNAALGSWVVEYPHRNCSKRARFFFKSDIRIMRILGLV